jgi:lipoate-protein ligase A
MHISRASLIDPAAAGPPGRDVAVWWDGAADGADNMAADELLAAEAISTGGLVVRLYGWRVPTLSLGAFQPLATARTLDGIDRVAIVRRPSGGGAILHGTDVTYAAAVPREHPLGRAPQPLYDVMHAALVESLAARGIAARLSGAAELAARPEPEGLLCFDRRAAGDVVAPPPGRAAAPGDPKILGSAQRRLAGAVVQHGSLLVRAGTALARAADHPGLDDLHPGFAADVPAFVSGWLERVAAGLGGRVIRQAGDFLRDRGTEVARVAAGYREAGWLGRR